MLENAVFMRVCGIFDILRNYRKLSQIYAIYCKNGVQMGYDMY